MDIQDYFFETKMRRDYQKMIELLAFVLHCPICNNKYNAEATNIIEGSVLNPGAPGMEEKPEDAPIMVHTDCELCKSSVVFSITLDGAEVFSVGMVTDLTSSDAAKFRDNEAITADQLIEFHNFLGEFDGNFQKILR